MKVASRVASSVATRVASSRCARQAKLISALAGRSKSAVQAAQAGLAKHSPQSARQAATLQARRTAQYRTAEEGLVPLSPQRSPMFSASGSTGLPAWDPLEPGAPFGRTCAGHGGCMPSSHLQALETGARRSRMETACTSVRAPLGAVWKPGTSFLGHGVQLSNPVQTRMLSFFRFAARGCCKFWNTVKLSHSDLLMRVIKADVELGRSCQASWSAQFRLAARELMGG
ncbi:hypothetical protein HaLaN_05743 [Haematococcus lacustris]|uniref:Uncharacterized protein n=1 Tax=Haematococcus lacustris TaxID=44745 RepID=A0A699YK42_HAELA|nr:hypothetical protein HaLaN_05743 [Haematococcus lacustris]